MFNVTHHSWRGPVETELDPADGLTEEADRAFSNGQCHALALALHDLTGLPLAGLEWDDDYADVPIPNHVFVFDPATGDALDVGGWNAAGRWNGGYTDLRPMTREEVVELYERGLYLTPNLDAAAAFAPLVLDEYAPSIALTTERQPLGGTALVQAAGL